MCQRVFAVSGQACATVKVTVPNAKATPSPQSGGGDLDFLQLWDVNTVGVTPFSISGSLKQDVLEGFNKQAQGKKGMSHPRGSA